jgi:transcriptional regulator with XRE-family HTH domain
MTATTAGFWFMGFAQRLVALRKAIGWTQVELAHRAELHVVQVRRYESNVSEPSLEAIRKLAIAFSVSADALLFEADERGPDDEMKLHFEAVGQLDPDAQRSVLDVIDGLLLKHQATRMAQRLPPSSPKAKAAQRAGNDSRCLQ